MRMKVLLFSLSLCTCIACSVSKEEFNVGRALDYCDEQVHRTLEELSNENGIIDYRMMPRNIMDSLGTWHCRKASKEEWCSGFWPGILWYDYEYTEDNTMKETAESFFRKLRLLIMIWVSWCFVVMVTAIVSRAIRHTNK